MGEEKHIKKGAVVLSSESRDFIERDLRLFSSHPYFGRRKALWLFRIPMWSAAFIVAWVAWKGISFDIRALFLATQGRNWAGIMGVGVIVFFVALAATWILSIRAAAASSLMGIKEGFDRMPLPPLCILLGGSLLSGLGFFYLPDLIPAWVASGASAQRIAFIAAFAPYVICLALLDIFTPTKSRSPILLVIVVTLALVVFVFFIVSAKTDWAVRFLSSQLFSWIPILGPWIAQMTGAVAQGVLRLVGAFFMLLTFVAIGEWTLSGIPEFNVAEQAAKKKGFWATLWRAIRRLFSLKEPQGHIVDSPDLETDWMKGLRKLLGTRMASFLAHEDGKLDVEWRPHVQTDNPSPQAPSATKNIFFGGLQPTQDQWDALEIFLSKSLGDTKGDSTGLRSCPDLLLEGGNGVGKTTTLMATALQTLLVKGDRAVIFAPDEISRRSMAAILNEWLEAAGFNHYIVTAEITDASHHWLEQPENFPDLLVASPDSWENLFFGGACDLAATDEKKGTPREQLRSRLLTFSAFFLDDVASVLWTAADLTQLPFLIDKQRLLLASGGRSLQVMATSTPLEEVIVEGMTVGRRSPIRDALIKRLFGGNEDPVIRRHFIVVRNWQTRVPDLLEIRCKPHRTLETMHIVIREALRGGKQVVAYVPELTSGRREEEKKEFLSRMQAFWSLTPTEDPAANDSSSSEKLIDSAPATINLQDFSLVCHINEGRPAGLRDDRDRLIIYDGSIIDNIVPQLFSRLGTSRTTVVALRAQWDDDLLPPLSEPMGFPLLVAREAMPLLCAHLRSAAVHLEAGAPLSREHLSAFGVSPAAHVPLGHEWLMHLWEPAPELCFLLDPPDPASSKTAPIEETSSDMEVCCFAPAESERRNITVGSSPVGGTQPLNFGWSYHLADSRSALQFGRTIDPGEDSRRAVWVDERRVTIAETDLAFMDEVSVKRGAQRFWCLKLLRGASGQLMLQGATHHGLDTQPTVPYWQLALEPRFEAPHGGPSTGQVLGGILGVDGPWEGTSPDVQVVELFLSHESLMVPGGSPNMSTSQTPAFTARVAIEGVMSERTRIRGAGYGEPAEFHYPAAITAILLGVSLSGDGRNLRSEIGKLLARSWDSDQSDTFWPELSLALQTGLRRFSPRVTQFCRLMAFAHGKGAIVFLIEPLATVGTIKPLLRTLLTYPELSEQKVVDPALEALRTSTWRGPGFSSENYRNKIDAGRLLRLLGKPVANEAHRQSRPKRTSINEKPKSVTIDKITEPTIPASAEYSCGKCGTDATAPSSKAGFRLCIKCDSVLNYFSEAADREGRYPWEFLSGLTWPSAASCVAASGTLERAVETWKNLARTVRYQLDEKTFGREEVWQTSSETLAAGVGDCEDLGLLLADWLLQESFDVRVVVGDSNFQGEGWSGHAWVSLRIEELEYILEPTINPKIIAEDGVPPEEIERTWSKEFAPLEVAKASAQYRPKFSFDRSRFWRRKGKVATGAPEAPPSYWSEEHWEEGLWLRQKQGPEAAGSA